MTPNVVILLVAALTAISVAGVGFAFFGRRIEERDRAMARVSAVAGAPGGRRSVIAKNDPSAQRRKQVQEQLKALEAKEKNVKRAGLRVRIERAGLSMEPSTFITAGLVVGGLVGGMMYLGAYPPIICAAAGLALGFGFPRWLIGFLGRRRIKAFSDDFVNVVDIIVRGVKAGLPLNECLKIIAKESPQPVKGEFQKLIDGQRVGVTLDQGLERMYRRIPTAELNFFSIVLLIQQKTGGNLAEALGNLSNVLRDRKKMRGKVKAMSSEAKSSAMIIGCLPFLVGLAVYFSTPDYIGLLFSETLGKFMLVGAAVWMTVGILVMRKMINFEI